MTTPSAGMNLDHQARLATGQACLNAALEFLERGLAVTCCCDPDHVGVGREHGTRCTSPGKAPLHSWKDFQTRLPTRDEVLKLWKNYPIANVGAALGQVSGTVRIDVDGDAGYATSPVSRRVSGCQETMRSLG